MLKGTDLSHHNQTVDFAKMLAAGYVFTTLKATEGIAYVDQTFKARWLAAKKANVIRGAYHFFRPGVDSKKAADLFCRVIGELEDGDMPAIFDWEARDPVDRIEQIEKADQWLEIVWKFTGVRPWIYGGPSFLGDTIRPPAGFAEYPLWIANYKTEKPRVPKPWTSWLEWQSAEDAKVPGISNHCDVDYFNGTLEDLKPLLKHTSSPVSGTVPSQSPEAEGWF